MSDFKYIGRNIVCEPYTFRSSITASNISGSGTITANRFVGYMDSASVSISSSYALTASYALNGGGSSLTTGSYYPITSSWALNSVSSSWAATAISSAFAYSSSWAATSSYFSGSISNALSSSYSLTSSYALTASYALNGGSGGGGIYVATSSIIDINFTSSIDKFITDGINDTYTLSFNTSGDSELFVFLDGLEQEPTTDYTASGTILTMIPIPPPNLELEVRKFYSSTSINIITSSLNAQYFTGDGVTTQYSLTKSVSNDYEVLVSFDGLIQKPTYDYTVTGSILNFNSAPPLNVDGEIRYLMTSTTGLVTGSNVSCSYALTASYSIIATTASYFSGSIENAISSSYALNADTLDGLNSTIFATTGSNTYIGNQTISNGYVILNQVSSSLNFSDDTAAAIGGVPLGGIYRNGNFILIRIT